jgi:hypothetical protein
MWSNAKGTALLDKISTSCSMQTHGKECALLALINQQQHFVDTILPHAGATATQKP